MSTNNDTAAAPSEKPKRQKRDGVNFVGHCGSCPGPRNHSRHPECRPYQADVWSVIEKRRIRKRFHTKALAQDWRSEMYKQSRAGTLRAPSKITFEQAAEEFLAGAATGAIVKKGDEHQPYAPATIRTWQVALYVPDGAVERFGGKKISEIHRADLVRYIEHLRGQQLPRATLNGRINPIRAIFGWLKHRGDIAESPARDLGLAAPKTRRVDDDSITPPDKIPGLLAALEPEDGAIWATAFYAGLRHGELRAISWRYIDLAGGRIRVEATWDRDAGSKGAKSAHGHRVVPMTPLLREILIEHRSRRLERGIAEPDHLVFGSNAVKPRDESWVLEKARKAWATAGLVAPKDLHAARHSYASALIAAGIQADSLQAYMGHSSITVTFDIYGHRFPNRIDDDATAIGAFFEAADTNSRIAQLG